MWRDQVIAVQHGEVQKLLRNFHANRVLTHILRTRATETVTIKAGHWIATTTFQFCSQNIGGHNQLGVTIAGNFIGEKTNANSHKIRPYKSDCQRLEKARSILLRSVWMRT